MSTEPAYTYHPSRCPGTYGSPGGDSPLPLKYALVTMRQCPRARSRGARTYLGYRCRPGSGEVEHLVDTPRGFERFRAECGGCVLASLLSASYVASMPQLLPDGRIRFLVVYNAATRKVLDKFRNQLDDVKLLEHRAVILTERQREALAALAEEAPASTRLAERLGVSRATAASIAKRALRKLLLYTPP